MIPERNISVLSPRQRELLATRVEMQFTFLHIAKVAQAAADLLKEGGDMIDVPYEAFALIDDDITDIGHLIETIEAGESGQP